MPFTEEDKHLIKVLRTEKGYSSRRFLKEFRNTDWSRQGLDKLLNKIDKHGSIERIIGSGRPRSVRTQETIGAVGELAMSQEEKPGTHRSVRQISHELSMLRSSVHDIIHNSL